MRCPGCGALTDAGVPCAHCGGPLPPQTPAEAQRAALDALVATVRDDWYNQTLTQVNDSVVRLGVMTGEYHWHQHTDDDEFFFVLEYLGLKVSDEKQEELFSTYDADGSGFIDYEEFKQVWLRVGNTRKELTDRGVAIPKFATKAQLMSAYALYERNKYDDAIVALDRFIQLHPGNKSIAYGYYLKGLCYYEQITDVAREPDLTPTL